MQRAVLISQDVRVINELTQICAVTGMELVIEQESSAVDSRAIYFIDASMTQVVHDYPHAHVICVGQPTSHVWLLAGQLNAESIITLPHDRSQLIELLTPQLASTGRVIAITQAVGGAGATTLAMAIAHQLKNSGYSCVLIDVNNHYAGLDLVMGLSNQDVIYSGNVMNNPRFGIDGLNSANDLPFISNNATHSPQQWKELINYLASNFDYVVLDIEPSYLQDEILEMCNDVVVALTNTIRDVAVSKILLNTLTTANVGLAVRSIPGTGLRVCSAGSRRWDDRLSRLPSPAGPSQTCPASPPPPDRSQCGAGPP